jgi:plastocyanin
MRFRYLAITLAIGSVALVWLTPREADAHGRRFHRGFYASVFTTYYSAPCPPVYYSPPIYYCYPGPGYMPSYGPPMPAYPPRPGATVTVGAYDNYFQPQTITVAPGTTVVWVNKGMHSHTVTSNAGLFDSGDLKPGASYTATFTRPGIFYYYCRYHTKERMVGTVVVGYGGGGGGGGGYGGAGSSGY